MLSLEFTCVSLPQKLRNCASLSFCHQLAANCCQHREKMLKSVDATKHYACNLLDNFTAATALANRHCDRDGCRTWTTSIEESKENDY